jgi:hypothetical protein
VNVSDTNQRMYALADFLGCKLVLKPGAVEGSGKWNQDCGLLKTKLGGYVADSMAGPDSTTPMVLILALSGDLGLGIYFVPAANRVITLILDLTKLGDKPGTFFARENCKTPEDGLRALHKIAKKSFVGPTMKAKVEVPLKDALEGVTA